MISCTNIQPYLPGDLIQSLVYHSPQLQIGTIGTVAMRWVGLLYAIRLPNGVPYAWLDRFELESTDPTIHRLLEGNFAFIITDRLSPYIPRGTVVQIIKRIEDTDYYEIDLGDGTSQHWLAGFEMTSIL